MGFKLYPEADFFKRLGGCLALALCLGFSPLLANERFNVEEGLPTALEDAFPIAERGR